MEKIDFYTTDNMNLFWEYVKGLLSTAAPGVMLWFSVVCVGLLLGIVVKAWKQSSKEHDDDDDDIEFRHY